MTIALVLESEENLRRQIVDGLSDEGYSSLACETIDAFSRIVAQRNIDVFLIDARLPDGDGVELVRELRSESDSGIILMACKSEEVDVVLGLEMGADDYVVKPFRMRELRARVNAVMRRTRGYSRLRSEITPVDHVACHVTHGLRIYGGSRNVKRENGELIDLTTLEFDVLAVLSSLPNHVFSRGQIMQKVRGPDWAANDRAIDGLISRLRQKLFPDGSGLRRLKTVRGVGYMLTADE
ncbi:response regulator transcription factor [Roseovarius sp.]|uniref:response regulator transcription factor n=1 Tax=Roseovarius sp. TaxID=1486281 RepID=UPI003562BCD7